MLLTEMLLKIKTFQMWPVTFTWQCCVHFTILPFSDFTDKQSLVCSGHLQHLSPGQHLNGWQSGCNVQLGYCIGERYSGKDAIQIGTGCDWSGKDLASPKWGYRSWQIQVESKSREYRWHFYRAVPWQTWWPTRQQEPFGKDTYYRCNNYVFSEMHFWINS